MSLPVLNPYPPAALNEQLPLGELNAFLESDISFLKAYLHASSADFTTYIRNEGERLTEFLMSFFTNIGQYPLILQGSADDRKLRKLSFLLVYRLANGGFQMPSAFLQPKFIGNFCLAFTGNSKVSSIVEKLWKDWSLATDQSTIGDKTGLIQVFGSGSILLAGESEARLRVMVAYLKASPSYGRFLMEGSDMLDSLIFAWKNANANIRQKLTAIVYFALKSLLQSRTSSGSLLLDHLYNLKHDSDQNSKHIIGSSILAELVASTPLLSILKADSTLNSGRGYAIIQHLECMQRSTGIRRKRHAKSMKGKKHAEQRDGLQMYNMSLVSQVQDLFPTLSTRQVEELLDTYENDTAKVVSHLIDNPPSEPDGQPFGSEAPHPSMLAQEIDGFEPSLRSQFTATKTTASQLSRPRRTDDSYDLANLTLSTNQLFIGKRENTSTLQASGPVNKAAIFSALEAFEPDSDERDDTYDVDDIGGLIDNTIDRDEGGNDDALYAAWKRTPRVFARDVSTRRGQERLALREATGMTDEAIEGWSVMLSRDAKRQAMLEAKFSMFDGEQPELQGTAWKVSAEDENGTLSGGADSGRLRGGSSSARRRGQGRGKHQHGSAVNGRSVGETSVQVERRRKDAHKGSRANHSRRDQRARKVARAGFPG